MRASRLLTILITLQLRGRVTAQALADQLEVSRRTIYRDVDELSAAGVPIYGDRGAKGGFALLGGFRTELTGLTENETEALLLAGVPAAAADLGLAGAASAARLKLLASMPEAGRAAAQRVAERFHLDPVDWYLRRRAPPELEAAARAVWEVRRLELEYESWTRTKHIMVEPLGLVLKAGRWYLIAASGGAQRIYRLDKARSARVTDEAFERPHAFDLGQVWRSNVERFERGLRSSTATLRVAPSALQSLEAISADIAEPLLAGEPDDAGWREAVVPIESIAHAASLLLGLGDRLEVIEPRELRHELARRAAGVVALYSRATPDEAGPAADLQ
jgi:predicted DNA-binding transcriptional regulator YafY